MYLFLNSLQYNLSLTSLDYVNFYPSEAVLSTTLCVVLLRQPLRTSLHCREIQASPETTFSCSQNPLIWFFNVDFDFITFLRMHAQGLQVKFLYRFLLSSTIYIFYHVLVILAFQFAVEFFSGCNCLSPLGLYFCYKQLFKKKKTAPLRLLLL